MYDLNLSKMYSNIEAERARKGWTIEETASMLGVCEATYRKRLAGCQDIKVTDIMKYAKVFDVSIDYLMGRTDKINVM